jgi:hypothetical protein
VSGKAGAYSYLGSQNSCLSSPLPANRAFIPPLILLPTSTTPGFEKCVAPALWLCEVSLDNQLARVNR